MFQLVSAQVDSTIVPASNGIRPCAVAFSPNGTMLAARQDLNREAFVLRIWEWHGTILRGVQGKPAPKLKHEFRDDRFDGNHTTVGCALAFSPDGRRVAVSTIAEIPWYGGANGVLLFDVETGDTLRTISLNKSAQINSIAFSRDGKLIAVGTGRHFKGGVYLLNVEDGTSELLHDDSGYSVVFSPDGKEFVVASGDQGSGAYTIVFDVETGYPIRRWNACYDPGDNRECEFFYYNVKQAVSYSTSGEFIIALAGYEGPGRTDKPGMLTVRDAITGEIESTARIGLGNAIMCVHPTRDLLLVGTGSGATLYELGDGAKLLQLGRWGGTSPSTARLYARNYLTFTPDGQDMILSLRDDGGLWQQTLYPKLGELKSQTYTLNKPIKPLELPRFEGGVPPITYTLAPISMPPGLFYDPEDRRIIGVPTSIGSWDYTYTAEDSGGLSDSIDFSIGANKVNFSINVVMPTSVDDVPGLDELGVYPTPTTDAVTFTQDGRVEIFDMIGRKVLDSKVSNGIPIQVRQLPAGLYLYSFLSRKGMDRWTGKLVLR